MPSSSASSAFVSEFAHGVRLCANMERVSQPGFPPFGLISSLVFESGISISHGHVFLRAAIRATQGPFAVPTTAGPRVPIRGGGDEAFRGEVMGCLVPLTFLASGDAAKK